MRLYALLLTVLSCSLLSAQSLFTNQRATVMPSPVTSGVAMAVSDMNGDGLDDVVTFSGTSNTFIYLQNPDGTFALYTPGLLQDVSVWGVCIADVDNDGLNDIAVGTSFGGTYQLRTALNPDPSWSLVDMPPTEFQQGSNFVDMDGDGYVDHFACDDVALSVPSRNNGDGTFTEDYSLINPVSTVPSDNSGNYASVWADYDNDGDLDLYLSKCRLGVSDENDGRRLNQLFRNNGPAGFTDVAEAAGLLPRAQCWATDFGDVDNDGDLDAFLVNHDKPSQLMLNNGDGTFTDVTAAWGMAPSLAASSSLGIQCNFEDFDNDGWLDLLVTYNASFAYVYRNTGSNFFSLLSGNSLVSEVSEQVFQSAASGDLNNDGYVDLYTGHAGGFNNPSGTPDGVLINQGGTNGFLTVRLQGATSNRNGIGARVQIHGSWGVQTREIRSGESYGISNSLTAYFGLGTDAVVDRLVVRWPSGLEEETTNVPANSRLVIAEGSLSATLPLEWIDVTARPAGGKQVRVDWATANEEATSHFVVERRTGFSWTTVAETPARNAAGNYGYTARDESPAPGENIYRVRQIDLTGAQSISPLATATLTTGKPLTLSPNPATTSVRITHNLPPATPVFLQDNTGRRLRTAREGVIDLEGLAPGVYWVRAGEEVERVVVR